MSKASVSGTPVKIKVVGLGGCGCNAVTRMVREGMRNVEFIAMNTDRQSLALTEAPVRLQLGMIVTKGMGAGGNRDMGLKAAEESRDEITACVSDSDIVFITCGMGGGTGTGSAPVVAEIARKSGALTIAVVSKPFSFEGRHRLEVARQGIAALHDKVDSVIIVPNARLLDEVNQSVAIDEAFLLSDGMLKTAVQVIAEVLNTPGLINLDFADIKAILKNSGSAFISNGVGRGPDRAVEAAQAALTSPLLDSPIHGSMGILFNIVSSDNLTMHEVNNAAEYIKRVAAPEGNIIFGVAYDLNVPPNALKITVIATGFPIENCPEVTGVDKPPETLIEERQPRQEDSGQTNTVGTS